MDTIVLCHGYPGFVRLGAIEYFRGVAEHLRNELGVEAFTPQVGPVGTIAERSGQMEQRLEDHFRRNPKRMHIIAHSVGGLDARHLVSPPPHGRGRSDIIATLTTIGTPHHGTCLAEVALGKISLTFKDIQGLAIKILKDFLEIKNLNIPTQEFENIVDFLLGKEGAGRVSQTLSVFDLIIEALKDLKGYATRLLSSNTSGLDELTRDSMSKTDKEFVDADNVEYFSYAGIASLGEGDNLSIVLYPSYLIVSLVEKDKIDGWISLNSATRDESTRIINADHAQQIGHLLPSIGSSNRPTFDHLAFYKGIIEKVMSI